MAIVVPKVSLWRRSGRFRSRAGDEAIFFSLPLLFDDDDDDNPSATTTAPLALYLDDGENKNLSLGLSRTLLVMVRLLHDCF